MVSCENRWNLTGFQHFQATLDNCFPEVFCFLMHTKSVRLFTWVFLCERACTGLGPAAAHGGQPEGIACDFFFNIICRAFPQKHLINRLWMSTKRLPVTHPGSCTASVFELVSLWLLYWVWCLAEWWASRAACKITSAPKPQTPPPPIPDELPCQPARKSAKDQTASYQHDSLFLLFISLNVFVCAFLIFRGLHFDVNTLERSLILPYSINKHKPQTNHKL